MIVFLIVGFALVLFVAACAFADVTRGPDHYVNGVKHKGLTWECAKCKRGET